MIVFARPRWFGFFVYLLIVTESPSWSDEGIYGAPTGETAQAAGTDIAASRPSVPSEQQQQS